MWKSKEDDIIKQHEGIRKKKARFNWQKFFSHYLHHVKQMAITLIIIIIQQPVKKGTLYTVH